MAWMFLRRGTRARAATAALLSSVVPGLGQLYNRDWLKAALMGAAAVGLGLVIKDGVARVVSTAMAATPATGIPAAGPADPTVQLLAAMALPGIQAEIRQVVLPALLGLSALLIWSMADAYRRARHQP